MDRGNKRIRSFGSDDISDKGLEFKIDSISITTVSSCNVNNVLATMRNKWCLSDFIIASHKPPK